MITCARCETKFRLTFDKVNRDTITKCPKCQNEFCIKDIEINEEDPDILNEQNEQPLGNADTKDNKQNFFAGLGKGIFNVGKNRNNIPDDDSTANSVSIAKHILIIILICKIIIVIFTLGIVHIAFVSQKFPMLNRFYESINIHPRTKLELLESKVEKIDVTSKDSNKVIIKINLRIKNNSSKSDIISTLKVVIQDKQNNTLLESITEPYTIIRGNKELPLQIRLPSVENSIEYISIYVNNTLEIDHLKLLEVISVN